MQEKTMVHDILMGLNSTLLQYAEMIPHIRHDGLRQTLITQRNACEKSQEQLYNLAHERGFYIPAAMAKPDEIERVKQLFTKSCC